MLSVLLSSRLIRTLTALAVCLVTSMASAAITLPLQGYYRPGRFFSIFIDSSDAQLPLTFSVQGCMTTQTDAISGGRLIAPILVTGQPSLLQMRGTSKDISIPLRQPREDEKLIATTTDDVALISYLFPHQKLLPIQLDPADLLPGPPVGWETLDALLLDSAVFSRITNEQRSALLAGGVMLISVGESPPDYHWPWCQRGAVWVLSHNPAGPTGELIDEDIYTPTYAWAPGWSATVRWRVMGIATLVVLLTLALLLRPNRWTMPGAMVFLLIATVGIIAWRRSLGIVQRAGGDIVIAKANLMQRDSWQYQRVRENSRQIVPWSGWTHPVFASALAKQQMSMELLVDASNHVAFSYDALVGHTMAFVRRAVAPGEIPLAKFPVRSPMVEAVKAVYLTQGDQLTGELPASTGRWATVVVNTSATQPTTLPSPPKRTDHQ